MYISTNDLIIGSLHSVVYKYLLNFILKKEIEDVTLGMVADKKTTPALTQTTQHGTIFTSF